MQVNHTVLVLEIGFCPVRAPGTPYRADVERPVPCARWLRHWQRHQDHRVLHDLLRQTASVLQLEIPDLGETVSFDAKHLYAWVAANNHKAYVPNRYGPIQQPPGDSDNRLGVNTNSSTPMAEPCASVMRSCAAALPHQYLDTRHFRHATDLTRVRPCYSMCMERQTNTSAATSRRTDQAPARGDYSMELVLGTRGSALALRQAECARMLLLQRYPDLHATVEVIQSLGDLAPDRPIESLGTQGIFTHALESALLSRNVRVAVHSAKDLPSTLAPGLRIVAAPIRADPRDCLVTRDGRALEDLRAGARVGTGSPRRAAQLLALRPDLSFVPIRGNVETRRRAALDGTLDAVILAAAGLDRLGLLDEHARPLAPDVCLPQAGQGTLALEARDDDSHTVRLLERIDDPLVHACLVAERAVLAGLAAGCQAPVAAFAEPLEHDRIRLRAVVADIHTGTMLRTQAEGDRARSSVLGASVAAELAERGAGALLDRSRQDHG